MSGLNKKHPFYISDDEFNVAYKRYNEIQRTLNKWPELKKAIESEDQNLFNSAMANLNYTDYYMVVRLFDLSKDAEHDITASFNEMSKKYHELVKVSELTFLFTDCVIILESPLFFVYASILCAALATSIALGKKGQLLPFIDNGALMTIIWGFAAGAFAAGIFLYSNKRSNLTKIIQKLKDYLASNPKLWEVYDECIASTDAKTAFKIMALMKN